MKRILGFILLLIFSLSFTPTELWHDCIHEHHETQASHSHDSVIDSEDCAVCDYHFSVYHSAEIVSPSAPFQMAELDIIEIDQAVICIDQFEPVNRGPPARA